MLYSQINYTGCFLLVSNEFIRETEMQITDFVRGKLRLSEKRLFDKIECGSLGLFKIAIFLQAQRCSWIKRATSLDEIWKMDLLSKSPGNILRVTAPMFSNLYNPVLHCLAESCDNLLAAHTKLNQNYRKAYIFNNRAMTIGVRGPVLDETNWGVSYMPENRNRYYNLTFNHIFDGQGNIRPEFLLEFNLNLQDETVKKLKKIYGAAITRYGNNTGTSESLTTLLGRVKKGSKTFRGILLGTPAFQVAHNLVKYSDNTDTIVNAELGKKLNAFW
jgi:hypothetical protein